MYCLSVIPLVTFFLPYIQKKKKGKKKKKASSKKAKKAEDVSAADVKDDAQESDGDSDKKACFPRIVQTVSVLYIALLGPRHFLPASDLTPFYLTPYLT